MLRADRSRTASPWVALAVLSTAMLMIILDGTIVSVALPALRADLGFTDAGLSWTVNAYLIPLGGLLLLAGRLGDLVGRRRILVAGLVLFVLASLACGLATGPAMLVAARAVQGVAAALASSVVLGMVVGLFDEPRGPRTGDGRLRLRRRGRGVDRPAARRGAHRGPLLARDLPGQRADRGRGDRCSCCGCCRAIPRSCAGSGPTCSGPCSSRSASPGWCSRSSSRGACVGSPPRWPSSCSPVSASARPGRRRRSCRRGCCARGRCRSATSPRCSPSPR